MRSRDSLNIFRGARSTAWFFCASAFLGLLLAGNVAAQTVAVPAPGTIAKPAHVAPAEPPWSSLTAKQKLALAPLEKPWSSLSDGQRRKWLTISESYPHLAEAEQEKLHSRMAEWAALSPKDREAARLNFAQSKAISKTDRAATWEAYQALTPEEREKLAQGAKLKPVGAAVSVKPVAPEKLTPVPVTRHTPEQERAAAVLQRPINRNTLLPQVPTGAASQPLAQPAKP